MSMYEVYSLDRGGTKMIDIDNDDFKKDTYDCVFVI